jgi:fatty acid desaturase
MSSALKTWKTIDVYGQIVVFALPWVLSAVRAEVPMIARLIGSLGISVWGWQMVSFIVHLGVGRTEWKARGRRIYALLLLFLVFVALISLLTGMILVLLYVLAFLFVLQGLAIFYLLVSYSELKNIGAMERAKEDSLHHQL